MRDGMAAKSFPSVRIMTAAVLILAGWTVAGWLPAGWAGQDPAKPAAQQEAGKSGKSKQPGRGPKEEEEETTKPARRVPLRVGDEDLDANPRAPAAKPGTVPPDLKLEAKQAKHAAVRDLFNALAEPHDVVTMIQNLHVWNVEPIAEFLNPKSGVAQRLTLRPFDAAWKQRQSFSVSSKDIYGFEPYEQLAIKKVDEFLKSGPDQDPASKQYLPRLDMLQEAEKALGAVLLYHDSAMQRGLRKGSAWNDMGKQLTAKLQEVQLKQLQTLTDLENWEAALDLGIRLQEAYPTKKDFLANVIKLMAKSARAPLKNKKYGVARKWLNVLESQFPNSPELEPIRAELRRAAQEHFDQAKRLAQRAQTPAALKQLEIAKDFYPDLPGLRDWELRLKKLNPVLYVGVPELPVTLSPATATVDSEKQAVELLFEGLLKLTYSPKMGQRYEPCLAADMPKMVPLGRQFTLARGASWSDGDLVTATDVRRTVELLGDSKSRGHIAEWAELLKDGARIDSGDNFHISLTLHQGYLDPLSLMDFKVLPKAANKADDVGFAKAPIGSGPYKLDDKSEPNRVVFVANPYYEMRPGKAGLPRIREIQFFRSENPTTDFQEERLQLLLDLPTSRYKTLDSAGLGGIVTFKTLPNRRIYFLAVNHRSPPLDSQPLRRAIGHAINREAILDQCFRAGLTPAPHRALNGPYPPLSWACPKPVADPYKLDFAKAQAKKATEGAVLRKLTLKYPKGDPDVEKACGMIQQQVQQLGGGIELELKAIEPRELRHEVEDLHDYDLAYYSWDYPDETYWLWPLFDPQATGSGQWNFLGYQNDDLLQKHFRDAMSRRDPTEVKRLTHLIHADIADRMPLIPLWQLDTHLAIHKSLLMVDGRDRPVDPDPLRIFTHVENWKLEKR